ncbi:ABC transporter ATP-binding protein [Portibacter marinus]|uniref:ABC transporter ATP-binding protein n=1 Tax=Portibacter marinus TaxID=2898660 RepID=UPI001F3D0039|nr:ABC transporter ATP-binding protein [Portibacter marinus]
MRAITIENLTKYYGKNIGIEKVSLQVEQGEVYGFIGPNGAGKSTTIRALMGLLIPTSGKAKILGVDVFKDGAKIRQRVGYLPSEIDYYDKMTSLELLEYHCRFYGITDYSKIHELASIFELDLEKEIEDLSFGNKKKCGIIQALVHEPEVLILDEPTSGLDPLMQNVFFDYLKKLNKEGITIFFSSHVLSEIQRICQRAAIIRNGKIVEIENIDTLLKKQMKLVKVIFRVVPDHFELPEGAQKQSIVNNKLSFEYLGSMNELVQWLSQYNIYDVTMTEPDLESLFMNYYER